MPPDSEHVVVLLGAGASHDAGLPLAADLTDRLREVCESASDRSLLKALGFIQGSLLLRRGAEGQAIDPRIDIEDILEVAELLAARTSHPISNYVAAWDALLEQLSPGGDGHLFTSLLSRAREMLREALAEPEDAIEVKYLADVSKLSQGLAGDRTPEGYPAVFTLNYDRCLELSLDYAKVPFTTGFNDGRWNVQAFNTQDRLRIFKLHGSFGWVRHPERGLLYDAEQAVGREDIDIESYDVPDELVFGAGNKLQATQPFLWMVNRLSEEVAASRYVVTIGYGYGDHHVNEIIAQGMASDSRKRLIVVDPKLRETVLEAAPHMRVYPERTSYVPSTAKQALHTKDEILKELERLQREAEEENPF